MHEKFFGNFQQIYFLGEFLGFNRNQPHLVKNVIIFFFVKNLDQLFRLSNSKGQYIMDILFLENAKSSRFW